MIRTLDTLLRQNTGFDAEHVVTMRMIAGGRGHSSGPDLSAFYGDLTTRLAALPGISAVGIVSDLPFGGQGNSSTFTIVGRASDPNGPALHSNMHIVGGEYFKAMGIPLLRGRLFDNTDVKDGPNSVVVDAEFARVFFPNEDPIGKRIAQGPEGTIVGVVGTVSQGELGEPPKATTYYCNRQSDWVAGYFVVVRTALATGVTATMVRNAVSGLDRNVPVFDLRTLGDRISVSLAPRRLARSVLTALAGLSLLLSVCGLYGVISYAVTQREGEFGIRVALGAQASDLRRMVLRQGMLLAAAGVAIGLVCAAIATSALAALLFGVSPRDPATFVGASVLIAAVALVASYFPARRATRVNPLDALRG
jgi:predicted permease